MMGFDGAGWGGGLWTLGGLLLVIGVVVLVAWRSPGPHEPVGRHHKALPDQRRARSSANGFAWRDAPREFEQAKKALGPDR